MLWFVFPGSAKVWVLRALLNYCKILCMDMHRLRTARRTKSDPAGHLVVLLRSIPPVSIRCILVCLGVGVGWQRRCKKCLSLRELDKEGTVFFFFVADGHHDGYRVRSCCAGW